MGQPEGVSYLKLNRNRVLLYGYNGVGLIVMSAWGATCSSVVRAFAHGAMGRPIDPSWCEPIELFFVPASDPRLV